MSTAPPAEVVFVVEDDPDGGFVASAVGQSIVTQAETMDALRSAVREAVACHFDQAQRPKAIRLHHVCDEVIAA